MEDSTFLIATDGPLAADESLQCPITQMLMHDPVILSSGHAVELKALQEFWRTCPFALSNPVTREPMQTLEDMALVPGLHLRSAIDLHLSRLAPHVLPDGWQSRDPGHRSTRDELRALSARMHRIATSAKTMRLGGAMPATASAQARACLGVYDRDARLTNDRPSYTMRGGTHAVWFSAVKPDGSANDFWHAAETAHQGQAGGHVGVHDPAAVTLEGVTGQWQVAVQRQDDDASPHDAAEDVSDAGGAHGGGARAGGWVAAPGLHCQATGSADDLAGLLASSARAVVVAGKLPATAPERDFYRYACLGVFDRDASLTNGAPSYTKRGGKTALWFDAERDFWHLGAPEHRGGGQGWLHAHARGARVAECLTGPWSLARATPLDGRDDPPAGDDDDDAPTELVYMDVPLRCDAASVELVGALPDAMLGGGHAEASDPHGVARLLGLYDLYERSPVHGRPAYVQRGTQATTALWYAENGYWHVGRLDEIGRAAGPLCARGGGSAAGVGAAASGADLGPERLPEPASWQVHAGTGWVRAPTIRCRIPNSV